MGRLFYDLLPLILGSALVPVQITVTILLLRSSVAAAAAWIGGMTAARLVQGGLFGLVFAGAREVGDEPQGPGPVASSLLLVIAVLFIVMAVRKLLGERDEDAPPPRWTGFTEAASPGKTFLLGAAYVAIAVKLWVFTLGAVGLISEAEQGRGVSTLAFVLYTLLAVSPQLAVVAYAALDPDRAQALLGTVSGWLERYDRAIVVVLGFGFGTWFLMKALSGFGVL